MEDLLLSSPERVICPACLVSLERSSLSPVLPRPPRPPHTGPTPWLPCFTLQLRALSLSISARHVFLSLILIVASQNLSAPRHQDFHPTLSLWVSSNLPPGNHLISSVLLRPLQFPHTGWTNYSNNLWGISMIWSQKKRGSHCTHGHNINPVASVLEENI